MSHDAKLYLGQVDPNDLSPRSRADAPAPLAPLVEPLKVRTGCSGSTRVLGAVGVNYRMDASIDKETLRPGCVLQGARLLSVGDEVVDDRVLGFLCEAPEGGDLDVIDLV